MSNYPMDMGYKPCDTLDPRSPFYEEPFEEPVDEEEET